MIGSAEEVLNVLDSLLDISVIQVFQTGFIYFNSFASESLNGFFSVFLWSVFNNLLNVVFVSRSYLDIRRMNLILGLDEFNNNFLTILILFFSI